MANPKKKWERKYRSKFGSGDYRGMKERDFKEHLKDYKKSGGSKRRKKMKRAWDW